MLGKRHQISRYLLLLWELRWGPVYLGKREYEQGFRNPKAQAVFCQYLLSNAVGAEDPQGGRQEAAGRRYCLLPRVWQRASNLPQ